MNRRGDEARRADTILGHSRTSVRGQGLATLSFAAAVLRRDDQSGRSTPTVCRAGIALEVGLRLPKDICIKLMKPSDLTEDSASQRSVCLRTKRRVIGMPLTSSSILSSGSNALHLSMVDPDKNIASQLLAARRSLRGTPSDGSYLDHFVQILCRLDADRHGFAATDLSAIEAAWVGGDKAAWSGGFVARLADGRRAHVDGRAGLNHWGEDSDIDSGLLEGREPHPELGARYGWQNHNWDEGLARGLNELLGKLAAERPVPPSSQ
jgi:hypothetical protein